MNYSECSSYEGCDVSICPLQPDRGIFYPGEETCQARRFKGERWIKTQRKINRLFSKGQIDDYRYFTINELTDIKVVRKGLKGTDPDRPYKEFKGNVIKD